MFLSRNQRCNVPNKVKPATLVLLTWCSNQLSYADAKLYDVKNLYNIAVQCVRATEKNKALIAHGSVFDQVKHYRFSEKNT